MMIETMNPVEVREILTEYLTIHQLYKAVFKCIISTFNRVGFACRPFLELIMDEIALRAD